jgi:hypothetical protein
MPRITETSVTGQSLAKAKGAIEDLEACLLEKQDGAFSKAVETTVQEILDECLHVWLYAKGLEITVDPDTYGGKPLRKVVPFKDLIPGHLKGDYDKAPLVAWRRQLAGLVQLIDKRIAEIDARERQKERT